MEHYVYKTVNNINGKYYYGVHSSNDPEHDPYFGSGSAIKAAVQRYGRENFSVQILKKFSSEEEAFQYERQLVGYEQVLDPNCYNLVEGGLGGRKLSPDVRKRMQVAHTGVRFSKEHREAISKAAKACPNLSSLGRIIVTDGSVEKRVFPEDLDSWLEKGWRRGRKALFSEETRRLMRERRRGKKHTEQTKERMRKAALGHPSWIKGKTPVNNGKISTYVYPAELEKYLSEGWTKGRLFKRTK